MSYLVIELENRNGEIEKHILVEHGEQIFTGFPAIDTNPAYLAWLETDEGKTYLAEKETN